jgi:hypothetical protein
MGRAKSNNALGGREVDVIEKTSRSCLKNGYAGTDIRAYDR